MIHQGDCREVLPTLAAESVQCCVTSPPYWGLRDYGTAKWQGGDLACSHAPRAQQRGTFDGGMPASLRDKPRNVCKCGAVRVDSQLGLEPTPEAYVENMVRVFREVRRVLRPDGVAFLNLGDSYATFAGRAFTPGGGAGLKPKDLVGIPWRVAFALQSDGWWLRSAIVWHKPAPMPESVRDRPTSSYEIVFLLAKGESYYYDAEAIAEPVSESTIRIHGSPNVTAEKRGSWKSEVGNVDGLQNGANCIGNGTRNARNVWTIGTKPLKDAHFATMPPELARRCILAGSKPGDTILDPFAGAGTTGFVAKEHGRNFVGIELNPEYIAIAERRMSQEVLGLTA